MGGARGRPYGSSTNVLNYKSGGKLPGGTADRSTPKAQPEEETQNTARARLTVNDVILNLFRMAPKDLRGDSCNLSFPARRISSWSVSGWK